MQTVWMSSVITWMTDVERRVKRGEMPAMSNVLFLHRSPLSIDIHAEVFHGKSSNVGKRMLDELRASFNISAVYCWSDEIRQLERLGEREYDADSELLSLLKTLKDNDEPTIQKKRTLYETYYKEGLLDASLPTTSTKQATANLLTMAGVKFDPVWNLDSLRAANNSE